MNSLKQMIRRQFFAAKNDELFNDFYVTNAPNPQNAINIFRGEWSSRFPEAFSDLEAGEIRLFEDERIRWFFSEIGSLAGQSVLELGPLEGGHSYMLEKHGADDIISVEANTRAYLKCLIAKEILGLRKTKFLCGDFVKYLKNSQCPEFSVGIASGVLYHMLNPAELIGSLANKCSHHLFIWTHYYDEEWLRKCGRLGQFSNSKTQNYSGFSHQLFRQYYGEVLSQDGFCGGSRPYSHWMLKHEIIECLNYFGFSQVKINFDQPDHPNGPAFAITASRS